MGILATENKKIRNATPYVYNEVHFRSKIEVEVYKILLESGLNPAYETETYVLMQGFKPSTPFYIRNKRTKEFSINNTKIIDWKYTPDFIVRKNNWTFFIEVKGKENDVYPYKRKMFFKLLESMENVVFLEVHTKRDCLDTINIINDYGNKETK